jgi:hypothetical protein
MLLLLLLPPHTHLGQYLVLTIEHLTISKIGTFIAAIPTSSTSTTTSRTTTSRTKRCKSTHVFEDDAGEFVFYGLIYLIS